nr:helix-turn-helix domain-containing protein [Lacticaseibacillus absianus]
MTHRVRNTVKTQLKKSGRALVTQEELRSHLLRRSLIYRLLDYLVKTPNPQIHRFCEMNFVSVSTTTRRVRQLNVLLKQFDIRLRMQPLALVGDELHCRFFLFMLYWQAQHEYFWPFEEAPTSTEDLQTQMFEKISHLRRGQRRPITPNRRLEVFGDKAMRMGFAPQHRFKSGPFWESSAFAFFQMSRVQLDQPVGTFQDRLAIELVLSTPETYQITEPLRELCLRDARLEWTDELDLDVFRILSNYAIMGSAVGQSELYFSDVQPDPELMVSLTRLLEELPRTPNFMLFHRRPQPVVQLLATRIAMASDTLCLEARKAE